MIFVFTDTVTIPGRLRRHDRVKHAQSLDPYFSPRSGVSQERARQGTDVIWLDGQDLVYTRLSEEEVAHGDNMPLRPHTDDIDDIKRRPDGVFLNWKERVFHILEFTRPYDSTREDLLRTDENKRNKYQPMHSKIMAQLQPHSWKGEVIALSIGVRGTVLEDHWQTALDKLDVPKTKHQGIMSRAVGATLTELDKIFQAHLAHRGRPPDHHRTQPPP